MNEQVINIVEDFSDSPYGRHPSDSKYCGENFRNNLLIPALKKFDKVIIELDGVKGLMSSFLEEAFGGIVREGFFNKKELLRKLEIRTKYKSYSNEILGYISEAEPKN